MDHVEISKILVNNLRLDSAPIGVLPVQEPPAGVKVYPGKVPAPCTFWRIAESGLIYAPGETHSGSPLDYLALSLPRTAEIEQELKAFVQTTSNANYFAEAELERMPRVEGSPNGYLYGPLTDFSTRPAFVVTWVTARQLMMAEEAIGEIAWTAEGGQFRGRPECATLALSAKLGKPVASVGSLAMREFTEIADELSLFVIPGVYLETFATKIQTVTLANEQMLAYYRKHKEGFPPLAALRTA